MNSKPKFNSYYIADFESARQGKGLFRKISGKALERKIAEDEFCFMMLQRKIK